MKNVYKVLRFLFGSGNNSSKRESYRIWAKTEYGNDWQFAYQYLEHRLGRLRQTMERLTNQTLLQKYCQVMLRTNDMMHQGRPLNT